MKNILVAFYLFPIFISAQQKCSIKGNVFYKYNEFIGNRADAGCIVILYFPKNIKPYKETSTDLNGNFSFESLDTGQYLIVVKSVQVKQKPEDYINAFRFVPLQAFFSIDINKELNEIYDSAVYYGKKFDSLQSFSPKKKKVKEERDYMLNIIGAQYFGMAGKVDLLIIKDCPYDNYLESLLKITRSGSISLNVIKLNNESPNGIVNVNFGITYL